MTSQELRDTRDALPFRPFVVHLRDGRSFPVPHRDYLSISPSGRTAIVYRSDSEGSSILDVVLITSLEVDAPPTPAAGS